MVGSFSYQISYQSLANNPHDDQEIVLRVKKFSCDALFASNLCFNSGHILIFLSHTLVGSNYQCYVNFLLVAFGNDVMTNDR
jgi:hypothetical protein